MSRSFFLMVLLCLAVSAVTAQEPVKTEPKTYKVAEIGNSASVSADGRMLAYADHIEGLSYEDVFVLDLLTGQHRRLTRASSEEEYGSDLVISPDGQQVAYEWITKDGSRELRLIGTDGTGLRPLYRNPEVHRIFPKRWSPDGKHILVILWREDQTNRIALLSAADGSVRVVKSLQGGDPWTRAMSLSPDGRYIAYDFRPRKGSSQRGIYVVSVSGGREVALVESPADDHLLDWASDGRGVLFTSDRTGTLDMWMIQVGDGKPQGQPTLVRVGFEAEVGGLGFDRKGSYYYVFAAWENDVYLAALDPATGRLHPPQKLVSHVGFDTSVEWSPDGGYLAYAWGLGYGQGPFVLGIRSLGAGQERRFRLGEEITRFGGHAFQPRWSPDGGYLLAQARDMEGRQGFYQIDARTGRVAPLVQTETRCAPDCVEWPVWSRDGTLFFTHWSGKWPGRTVVARDLENGRETELYRVVAPGGIAHLAVSPDGEKLAFVWWDSETGAASVKVMPVAGGEPRELVQLPRPELTSYAQPLVELAWMPDSRHVIYATSSASQPKLDFWRISAEGGEPEHLGLEMEGLRPYGLSVHPDGRHIAFTAGRPHRNEVWVLENFLPPLKDEQTGPRQRKITFDLTGEDGYAQIYVVNQDGSGLQQLTDVIGKDEGDVKGNQLPVWSPDRKKIAFVSTRDRTWEVYVMNADGSNQQRLTYTTKGRGNSSPAWSPDGKKIVFNSVRDGNPEIYVMSADGSNVRRLTHDQGEDASPAWSPDGKKIAFYSTRDGNREIYVMEGDGSNLRRLTHHQGDDAVPHWSPDGRRIAFQSNRHGGSMSHEGEEYEIYVMDADGSNVQRLTHTPGRDKRSWSPAWSPDGKRIVFHSNRDGTSTLPPTKSEGKPIPLWKRENWFEYEIYVMDADGSNVRRLTFNKKIDLHPDW